jgi:hypothetical protein
VDTLVNKKFELHNQTWRVSVPRLRLSRPARIFAAIGIVLGLVFLFFVIVPLGFAAKAGNGQALELLPLLILLLTLAGQHFVFRMIMPDQYRIADAPHFAETAKLFLVYWVAYFVILSLILLKLGGGE